MASIPFPAFCLSPLDGEFVVRRFPAGRSLGRIVPVFVAVFGLISVGLMFPGVLAAHAAVTLLMEGRLDSADLVVFGGLSLGFLGAGLPTFLFCAALWRASVKRRARELAGEVEYGLWITSRRVIVVDEALFRVTAKPLALEEILSVRYVFTSGAPWLRFVGANNRVIGGTHLTALAAASDRQGLEAAAQISAAVEEARRWRPRAALVSLLRGRVESLTRAGGLGDAGDGVLLYRVGARLGGDPFGEVELELHSDGAVRLERWRGTFHDTWRGRTTPETWRTVTAALAASSFPEVAQPEVIPPGAVSLELSLMRSGRLEVARTVTSIATRTPGLAEAVAALDLLARAASGGVISTGWGTPPAFSPDRG